MNGAGRGSCKVNPVKHLHHGQKWIDRGISKKQLPPSQENLERSNGFKVLYAQQLVDEYASSGEALVYTSGLGHLGKKSGWIFLAVSE